MANTDSTRISANVVRLGWVSLLTDISSEMLYPTVPIFITTVLGSYPAGTLADRIGSRKVYSLGLFLFSLVYLGFAFNHSPAMVWVLFAVYGFHTAFTDGVGKAYASKLAQKELRVTGMGVYHMSTGLATFGASTIAGLLWQTLGFRATFICGAAASLLAIAMFISLVKTEI